MFRCESILLETYWVLVIMDQFTRRIIGFGVHAGDVDGIALCCMFNSVISNKGIPRYLSSDNDPLFRYHRWQANLRILDVNEIKSIPHSPTSHPFIKCFDWQPRCGTVRRKYLDHLFFWIDCDLERKLESFAHYYNQYRIHQSLDGKTPANENDAVHSKRADLGHYSWQSHCNGLFQTPIAA